MKLFLSCSLILTWACVTLANEPVKWGRGKGNILLYRVNVERPAIEGFAQDVYVAYPIEGGEKNVNMDIVDIWIYERNPSSPSGTVPVLAYGVDKDLVGRVEEATVILRGQRSHAINSTVEFYGKIGR